MTRKQLAALMGILIAAILMAFFLRDVVERVIILPLAYLWWWLKLYYTAFSQIIYWAALVFIALIVSILSLIPEPRPRPTAIIEREKIQGNIEKLAEWLEKSQRGSYYKWLVANRLGKNAREILAQREGKPINTKFGPLTGQGWNPPPDITAYLESGLNGSFADYPRPRFWKAPQSTPMDMDPQAALDYLEKELEITHGRNRKSS